MADCIDIEARHQVGALNSKFVALSTDYWGKDGSNGHRSRSVAAQAKLESLAKDLDHYKDKEREDTCFGLVGLAEHKREHDKILADAIVKRIAELNAEARKHKTNYQWVAAIAPYFGTLVAFLIAFKDQIFGIVK